MKKIIFVLSILISMVAGVAVPTDALEIRSRDRVIALISDASMARTPWDLDKILRNASEEAAPLITEVVTDAYGVVWYDNWKPRARIWLKNIEAERLFRDILPDTYLLEAVELDGLVNIELEIRAGNPATIRGRLLLRNADLRWKAGDFALRGVNGFLPFNRFIGQPDPYSSKSVNSDSPDSEENNISIDTMVWSSKSIATHIDAAASYDNMILRFDRMNLNIMGGGGLGTVVMDHRGKRWKFASMIKFSDVDLNRLYELLPGLPLFARITTARLKGQIGILFEAPNRIRLTGKMESMAPGIIELSPLMHQRVRGLIDSRQIPYKRMTLELSEDNHGKPEARVNLHRPSARNIYDLTHGVPLLPSIVTVRIPLLPFVQELSR